MARSKNAKRIERETAEAAANLTDAPDDRSPNQQRAAKFRVAAQRETVEAFVVAFILALLFRAFLAEAFVIPTGSMAPTLMGAHKDLVCDRCSQTFPVGASRERSGPRTDLVVVGGICPNCRHINSLDLKDNSDHTTFNGDRILVSKFKYMIAEPERWDVIVFKYPGNPKQNYIKRLVGLPGETLTLSHGDVFSHPTGTDDKSAILRKPPSTMQAMSHLVYDTDHQAEVLIQAGYPSRWQPWATGATAPPTDSWKVERSADGLVATVQADQSPKWLRYFHHWPTDEQWAAADQGESLADADPYQSRAITDFYAYDSYIQVPAGYVYDDRPSVSSGGGFERSMNGGYSEGSFSRKYQSGGDPSQFRGVAIWGGQDDGRQELGRDGLHWVGDLIYQADVETSADAKALTLELVEAGIKYQCRIDLADGKATLSIIDAQERTFDDGNDHPVASTGVRAGSRHTVQISNCDDKITLWVDGDVVSFDSPTTYDARDFRSRAQDHPQWSPEDPLDAAPAGIAITGGQATVRRMEVRRDQYYIATNDSSFGGIFDYDMAEMFRLAGGSVTLGEVQQVFTMPDRWADFIGWETRREVSFPLEADQFFPMGDNSPESLDARCWAGTKNQFQLPRGVNEDAWRWSNDSYVPRNLLVGKALVVFWPHSWSSPVPFTPNFKRMKLIR
ncbi:Signal peptidase I [Rubripirellula lacrimiformis]|uniref:Signal peptidase I n=1 Tax=Rubripirellula lacrimiformis TaxID=1930273 RepID=A0A517NGC0_9BACT|nr:signal peptidase I [Rubripirellula lacrimiformis]QDT06184.1 Signal peptidase I [Rubripirellula lacrimiformis]